MIRTLRRAALLVLAALAAACGGEAVPAGAWRPGDTLLDELESAELAVSSGGTLPEDVLVLLSDTSETTRAFEAGAWEGGRAARVPTLQRTIFGVEADVRAWRLPVDVALDEPGARWRLEMDGVALTEAERVGGEIVEQQELAWLRETPRLLVFPDADADADAGVLRAYGPRRPGRLVLRRERVVPPALLEHEAAATATDPAALRRRTRLQRVERDGLLLAAPGALVFEGETSRVDALEVAVGQPALGWSVERGALVEDPAASDGVLAAVELERDGERTRLWQRRVQPGEGWHVARVPLPRGGGRARLRLVSEPGEAGESRYDYLAWAGLRLRGPVERAPERPHLVFVDVDTWRADRLGVYGAPPDRTPRLDAWAAEQAVVFTDAVATASWTLPSTLSMLTGLAVQQHEVYGRDRLVASEDVYLATRLRRAGYETLAMSDGGFVSPAYGLSAGFDVFDYQREQFGTHADPGWDAVLDRLARRRSERPAFVFLQTYLVHAPFPEDRRFEPEHAPYEGWLSGQDVGYDNVITPFRDGALELDAADRAHISRLYDAGVARVDEILGAFLARLDEVLGEQPYAVVVTSDHGEELFDHGSLTHGRTLYDELLRVPLLVRFPHARAGRSDAPVSTLDLVPTLLDLAGLPIPDDLPGHTLADPPRGPRLRLAGGSMASHAVRFDGHKLVVRRGPDGRPRTRGARLYDLREDPGEHTDVAERRPRIVERMVELLGAFEERYPALGDEARRDRVDSDVLDDLAELGYLGDDG